MNRYDDLGVIEDEDGYWYLASHPGEGLLFSELPPAMQQEIEAREWREARRWIALAVLILLAITAASFALGGH